MDCETVSGVANVTFITEGRDCGHSPEYASFVLLRHNPGGASAMPPQGELKMSEDAQTRSTDWTSTQTYVLAVVCLLVGVAVGYLLRGSGSPQGSGPGAQTQANQLPGSTPDTMGARQVSAEQLKQMADQQAAPLVSQLKAKPGDPVLLAQVGNIYYDAHLFKEATDYYARSLEGDPKNTDVRTDMATAYWYLGDADRALAEFDRVLKQQPNKANALLNRGIVRWQGKLDVKGAVVDWESLLKADPNFAQRSDVERLIAQAKKHSNIKAGEKTSKPAM